MALFAGDGPDNGTSPTLFQQKKLPRELFLLGFAGEAERGRDDVMRDVREFDLAVLAFVFGDIVLESLEQALSVLGSHDEAADHLGFRNTGHHLNIVHDELTVRVSDDCKIGIDALSDVRGKLDIEFFLRSVHS